MLFWSFWRIMVIFRIWSDLRISDLDLPDLDPPDLQIPGILGFGQIPETPKPSPIISPYHINPKRPPGPLLPSPNPHPPHPARTAPQDWVSIHSIIIPYIYYISTIHLIPILSYTYNLLISHNPTILVTSLK